MRRSRMNIRNIGQHEEAKRIAALEQDYCDVMRSAFGYRFKVTSKQNNSTLGTGFFRASKEMTKEEQINFLHQYTNGHYLAKESFITIEVFEACF